MRLPGTRYQEHGWEQVRKLLGHCSLTAFGRLDPVCLVADAGVGQAASLADYIDLTAEALREAGASAHAAAPGNSYGESAHELALTLLYELLARPGDWIAMCTAMAGEHARIGAFWQHAGGDAILRKKVNDMYAVLRDKVDSDNYQVACGRECSPNKMYAYRMLDTAYGAIAAIFADWERNPAQVGAILGREVTAMPIEVRQLRSIVQCRAEWIMAWSESLECFGGAPGPLHTRSKRFASLKNSPDKIALMLSEIGEYEALSSNRDRDWLLDAGEAAEWMDDLFRVLEQSEAADAAQENAEPSDETERSGDSISPAPRSVQLTDYSLPVRLAVYLKMLGSADDAYPDDWLDPATGELPTMQQLATMDQVSLPTLRKRRDAAIASLTALPNHGG